MLWLMITILDYKDAFHALEARRLETKQICTFFNELTHGSAGTYKFENYIATKFLFHTFRPSETHQKLSRISNDGYAQTWNVNERFWSAQINACLHLKFLTLKKIIQGRLVATHKRVT